VQLRRIGVDDDRRVFRFDVGRAGIDRDQRDPSGSAESVGISMTPIWSNIQPTLPFSPSVPPARVSAARTSLTVRFRLSVCT
jgi:hypothetical protein